ncbi:hypothetical protein, partial [Pseudomonas aeruginosa]|uniref:hypothetical protein n=1 Tax=Pseudomonas aeruginosa TaxID=287 RepID=UPI0015C0A60F
RACVDALLDLVLERPTGVTGTSDLPVELVVRQSTGVVPASAAKRENDIRTATPRDAVTTP